MSILKQNLAKKIEEWRPRTRKLLKDYSDVKISDVTIAQAMGVSLDSRGRRGRTPKEQVLNVV